jgi:hypothetical protein
MRSKKLSSIAEVGEQLENVLHGDLADEVAEATRPQPNSIDPGDPVCVPVMVERRRRKTVDLEIEKRLIGIEVLVARTAKSTRLALIGISVMVGCALLEYAGILGHDTTPIWATAIVDGVRFAFGGAQ